MSDQVCLIIDLDRCWGCRACRGGLQGRAVFGARTQACFLLVEEIGPRRLDADLHKDYVPVMCRHCRQPACLEACPEGAIQRAADASVQIDRDPCTRCQACLEACPYGRLTGTRRKVLSNAIFAFPVGKETGGLAAHNTVLGGLCW